MSNFQCSICQRNFIKKSHLVNHLNKKNKCQPIISEITTVLAENTLKIPEIAQQIPISAQQIPQFISPQLLIIDPNQVQNTQLLNLNIPQNIIPYSLNFIPNMAQNNQLLHSNIYQNNNTQVLNHDQNIGLNTQNIASITSSNTISDTQVLLDDNITCNFCNKTFARKNALYRHVNNSCKIVKQQNKNKQEIFDKLMLLETKNKQLEEEIKNKDIQLEVKDKQCEENINKLKDEIKTIQSITVNNNSNNTNSNNTTNNTININVVPHGEEDLSKYSNLLLVLAAKRGINAVLELTDRIHFNPQLPEFQNVYIPDIKNKHAMVFDKEWELKNTDDVISNIYDTKCDFIRDNKDVFFDYLSVGEKAVYERWANADNNRNTAEYKAYINCMHEKLKLLLYNKRNMVIATKKLQSNKKLLLKS